MSPNTVVFAVKGPTSTQWQAFCDACVRPIAAFPSKERAEEAAAKHDMDFHDDPDSK